MSNTMSHDLDAVLQQIRLAEAMYRNVKLDGSTFQADGELPASAYEQLIQFLLPDASKAWGMVGPDGRWLVFGASDKDVIVIASEASATTLDAARQFVQPANENEPVGDVPARHDLNQDDLHQSKNISPNSVLRNFDADEWTNSPSTVMFRYGDIPVDSNGSATMQGGSSNEMFDGDAWLRVRIDIVTRLPGEEAIPFEDIPNDEAHFVKTINSLAEVQADLLAGLIDPGQLRIVRDVISTVATANADVVAVQDQPGMLTIEGTVQRSVLPDLTGEGLINVNNSPARQPLQPANDDGTDLLLNLERVRFINEGPGSSRDSTGLFSFSGGRPGQSRLNSALPFILAVGTLADPEAFELSISFFWEMLGSIRSDWDAEAVGHGQDETSDVSDDASRMIPAVDLADATAALAAFALGSFKDHELVGRVSTRADLGEDQTHENLSAATSQPEDEEASASAPAYAADVTGLAAAAEAVTQSGTLSIVLGTSGNDTISMADASSGVQMFGGAGDDYLYGSSWNDEIYGGAGNDVIDGLAGDDLMAGGVGDDAYYIDSLRDVVVESAGRDAGARDIAYVAIGGYTLAENVEIGVLATATGGALTGNSGGNILIGGAGNDIIAGGGGNDLLIGGKGADQLDGGSGDDTIVYDAADDLANVRGGSGRDTLSVQGDAPVDFDLKGQGFELAVVNRQDAGDAENWSTIIETYVDDWQLASESGVLDDGGTWNKQIELAGEELYDYVVDYFNASGDLTNNLVQNRDGSSIATFYDVDDLQDFLVYIDYRDAQQRQTGEFVQNDDLTSNDTNYDAADEFDWRAISNTADNSGRITTVKTVYDDDSLVSVRYDASRDGDAQDWRSVTEYINAAGTLTREYTAYDNGNVRDVYFDIADMQAWNYEAYIYDPEGKQVDHYFG